MKTITCIAPVNIALIKYWGKRDELLILPLNDSISATLSTKQMHSKTTVMISPGFTENRIWLNGREESFDNQRLINCLAELQKAAQQGANSDNHSNCRWKVHICSHNNFPTAAGLASSAAGYACLVYCLAELYGIKGEISHLARLGSGSACRSLFGGFVHWHKGSEQSGSDSVATQLFPASHWPHLRIIIIVVNDTKKKMSSTSGMQRSVGTSELLKHRVAHSVPQRIELMIKAIREQDFGTFADITMKESNQFHAICLDTFPPAVYMNDTSHAIASFVHDYNKACGETKLAYTFDAGPNAVLFLTESKVEEVLGLLNYTFPPTNDTENYIRGKPCNVKTPEQALSSKCACHESGLLKYMVITSLGEGPQVLLVPEHHQLLTEHGLPKTLL